MTPFYEHNSGAGLDVAGYLEAVRAHEKLHSTKMKETIGANDPAAKLEALLSTDRAALRTQADGEIKRAEQRVCRAAADPIRGERMREFVLEFPRDDTDTWFRGRVSVGGRGASHTFCE